jgi:methyl-coenzyme M reductase operon protein D
LSEPNEGELPYNLEVVIFPDRLCSDETVANFLVALKEIDGITQILLSGPRTYDLVKRKIKVGSTKEIILDIQVGKFFIEIEHPEVIIDIRAAADRVFSFGYKIGAGRYNKYQKTTMDHVRGYTLTFRKDILEREPESPQDADQE